MSRPTQEMVEDGVVTWQVAMYELHREIDKLDQVIEIMRQQSGEPVIKADLSPDSLEQITIEVRPRK